MHWSQENTPGDRGPCALTEVAELGRVQQAELEGGLLPVAYEVGHDDLHSIACLAAPGHSAARKATGNGIQSNADLVPEALVGLPVPPVQLQIYEAFQKVLGCLSGLDEPEARAHARIYVILGGLVVGSVPSPVQVVICTIALAMHTKIFNQKAANSCLEAVGWGYCRLDGF